MRTGGRARALLVTALVAAAMAAVPTAAKAATSSANSSTATATSSKRLYPTVAQAKARRATNALTASVSGPQLAYRGGVDGIGVQTGPARVYLVFWGSQWGTASPAGSTNFSRDPAHMAPRLEAMYRGIGTNGERWSNVMTEYCEAVAVGASSCPASAAHIRYPTGGVLAGIWDDISTEQPPSPSSDQLASEAARAAAHFGNATQAANRNTQYIIASATGTHPDGFPHSLFCAWHGYTASSYGDLAFTNMPYVPDEGENCGANFVNPNGQLDGVSIVAGHEYAETITDPLPIGGWFDDIYGENADICAWIEPNQPGGAGNIALTTGSLPMQGTWSNRLNACALTIEPPGPGVVGVFNNTLLYTAKPGQINNIKVVQQLNAVFIKDSQAMTAGLGCTAISSTNIKCKSANFTLVVVNGGDGDDTLQSRATMGVILAGGDGNDAFVAGSTADGPTYYVGGAGIDSVSYSARTTSVVVSLDNQTNDGATNEKDSVRNDVEKVVGGSGNDVLIGSANAANTLDGGLGSDLLFGVGAGDTLLGGFGSDTLYARNGVVETKIDCGGDIDSVQRDAFDPTAISCEKSL